MAREALKPASPATIELRVEKLAHLFDPLDPFPIPSRDLAKSAEEFILASAREADATAPLAIVAHLPVAEAHAGCTREISDAVHNHFRVRAQRTTGDLHAMFRQGRTSLLIGLAMLAACMTLSRIVGDVFGDGATASFVSEGLIILGWVANWRPIEIFLYDWWPLVQQRRLSERIAAAPVEVRAY